MFARQIFLGACGFLGVWMKHVDFFAQKQEVTRQKNIPRLHAMCFGHLCFFVWRWVSFFQMTSSCSTFQLFQRCLILDNSLSLVSCGMALAALTNKLEMIRLLKRTAFSEIRVGHQSSRMFDHELIFDVVERYALYNLHARFWSYLLFMNFKLFFSACIIFWEDSSYDFKVGFQPCFLSPSKEVSSHPPAGPYTWQFTSSHCAKHQVFCQESIRKLASSSLKITSTAQEHQKNAKHQAAKSFHCHLIKPRLMKASQKVLK